MYFILGGIARHNSFLKLSLLIGTACSSFLSLSSPLAPETESKAAEEAEVALLSLLSLASCCCCFTTMAADSGNIIRFTYTGANGEWIDDEATHVVVQARVVRARAFSRHPHIVEVICHGDVEKIEAGAFWWCRSLRRRVIMRGVKTVEGRAFKDCCALEDVECDKLEIIGERAFGWCTSLRSTNLPSARIVHTSAFLFCRALSDLKFGSKLERIEKGTFCNCRSLNISQFH